MNTPPPIEGGDEAEQLALADRHDAEGRHTDAITVLSLATSAGSAIARGRLGARLLIGDRAPLRPLNGTRFIQEAANGGSAEAATLAAVLAAAGAYRPQNWPDALALLGRAAQLGDASARGQLGVLSEGRAAEADASDEDWEGVAASIDVGALVSIPAGRTLNEEPLIRTFESIASPRMCSWLIGRSQGRLVPAEVYDTGTGKTEIQEMRTNTTATFNLVQTDVIQIVAQARMAAAAGVPYSHLEAAGVLHYAPGEQISEHFDFFDPQMPEGQREIAARGQRVVTFLIYLNDAYEGGETEFPEFGLRHRGGLGDGIFFVNALASGAPDKRSLHIGRPPSSGEKWIITQFIRNRPFLPGQSPDARSSGLRLV